MTEQEIKDKIKTTRFYLSMQENALHSYTDEKISGRMINNRPEKAEEHRTKIAEYNQQIENLEQQLKQLIP